MGLLMNTKTENSVGWIEVITGCKNSGKTEEAIRRAHRAIYAKQEVIFFSQNKLHSTFSEMASSISDDIRILAKNPFDIFHFCENKRPEVVVIDDAHLYNQKLISICRLIADMKIRVIVSGLNMDNFGNPYPTMSAIHAIAEYSTTLNAICTKCGNPANHQIEIPKGSGIIKALCRKCFFETLKSRGYCSCFISYSTKDKQFADQLHEDLNKNNVNSWYAPKDLRIGDDILDTINEAIRRKDRHIIIFSSNALKSDWVENEVKLAFAEERVQKKKFLFPIRLDNSVMSSKKSWASLIRETRYIGDFTNWKSKKIYRESFMKLLDDIIKK
jgi:thymidine kinase